MCRRNLFFSCNKIIFLFCNNFFLFFFQRFCHVLFERINLCGVTPTSTFAFYPYKIKRLKV